MAKKQHTVRSVRSMPSNIFPRTHRSDAALNIACIVIIVLIVVIVAVALAVYFSQANKNKDKTNGKNNNNNNGVDAKKPVQQVQPHQPVQAVQPVQPVQPHQPVQPVQPVQSGQPMMYVAGTTGRPAQPMLAPAREGILFPRLSQQDAQDLKTTQQFEAIAHYQEGQYNATIGQMDRYHDIDQPSLFKGADYFPHYRGENGDQEILKHQVRQSMQESEQFAQSEDYHQARGRQTRPDIY